MLGISAPVSSGYSVMNILCMGLSVPPTSTCTGKWAFKALPISSKMIWVKFPASGSGEVPRCPLECLQNHWQSRWLTRRGEWVLPTDWVSRRTTLQVSWWTLHFRMMGLIDWGKAISLLLPEDIDGLRMANLSLQILNYLHFRWSEIEKLHSKKTHLWLRGIGHRGWPVFKLNRPVQKRTWLISLGASVSHVQTEKVCDV